MAEYKNDIGANALKKATLKKEYKIINGDEEFYRFVGDNSAYSMLELIHPDDVKAFKDAVELLSEGTQVIMTRVKDANNHYVNIFMVITYSRKTVDDFRLIDLELWDFELINKRYGMHVNNLKKYRMFLSMIPMFYFEYVYKTDQLVIYQYLNQKSIVFFRENMKLYVYKVLNSKDYSEQEKERLCNLYEALRGENSRFEVEIDGRTIGRSEDTKYRMKGNIYYNSGTRDMNIGVIEAVDDVIKPEKYYLSDNAYDAGTGIFNKRAINEYIQDKISEYRESGKSFYLAILDVDYFKNINDSLGHMYGDLVLAKLAETIRGVIDYKGCCGRFGGDEFVICFDQVRSEQELRNLIKTINKNFSYALVGNSEKNSITTSWGISKYPDDGIDFESIFTIADKALYVAKEKGKNRYIIYDKEKHESFRYSESLSQENVFHDLVSTEEKGKLVSNIVISLYEKGIEAISGVLPRMREQFGIDGISVYRGERLIKIYSDGKYVNPVKSYGVLLDEKYIEQFDDNGVWLESRTNRLSTISKEAYIQMVKQETEEFVQCIYREAGNVKALVSFDFFNRSPKVSENDVALMTVVGKLIVQLVGKNT